MRFMRFFSVVSLSSLTCSSCRKLKCVQWRYVVESSTKNAPLSCYKFFASTMDVILLQSCCTRLYGIQLWLNTHVKLSAELSRTPFLRHTMADDEQTLEDHTVAEGPAEVAAQTSDDVTDSHQPTTIPAGEVYNWLVWQDSRMRNKFHKGMLMHSLARDYYRVRAYWLHFLPLLGVTLLISILSFNVDNNTTSDKDDDHDVVTILTTRSKNIQHVISILGVMSTLLTSIGKYFNYQTQTDVHHNAYMALKDIFDRELFVTDIQRKFKKSIIKKCASLTFTGENDHGRLSAKMHALSEVNVDKLMQLYESIEKGCNGSDIPIKIRQAFDMLEKDAIYVYKNGPTWYSAPRRLEKAYLQLWRLYYKNRPSFPKTFFPWYIQDFRVTDIHRDDIKDRTSFYALNSEEEYICSLQTTWEDIQLERMENVQNFNNEVKYAHVERKAENDQNHRDALSKLRGKRQTRQAQHQPTDSVPPMGTKSEEAAREEEQNE